MNRRDWLLTAGGMVLPATLARGGDWPQLLGPARNGTSPENDLLPEWPKKGPPVLWTKEVGEGYAGPIVVGDKLLLMHRAGDEDLLDCLEAGTGKSVWRVSYPTKYEDRLGKGNGPRATPTVDGDRVYTLSAEGVLRCAVLKDGKANWETNLLEKYAVGKSFFGVGTSPLVEGSLVLVNVGGEDAGIVAFNKDTGKEVWRATSHEASYSSPVAVTLDGTRRALFLTREGIVSVDPGSGKVAFSKKWRSRMDASVNAATPLVVGDEVFVTASYGAGAILSRVKKGKWEEVWSGDKQLSCHFGTPVVHDGHLYGFHGRQEQGAELRCVEWKSGKVCWSRDGFGCGSVLLVGGKLLVLGESGELGLVEPNPAKFDEKARARVLDGTCRALPALSGGRFFARDDRKLVCVRLTK